MHVSNPSLNKLQRKGSVAALLVYLAIVIPRLFMLTANLNAHDHYRERVNDYMSKDFVRILMAVVSQHSDGCTARPFLAR